MNRSRLPGGAVSGLAFLPGSELLAVTPSGLFRLLGDEYERVAAGPGVGGVAAHPSGELAAWVVDEPSRDSSIEIITLPGGALVRRLHHSWMQPHQPLKTWFTPDGSELHVRHGTTLRWSVGAWRMLEPFPAWIPQADAWSERGHRFSGAWEYSESWTLTAPGVGHIRSERTRNRRVTAAVFSPDSRVVYLAVKSRIRRLSADTGEELSPRDWGLSRVTALAVSADGLTAAMGTLLGEVVVWDEG